MLLPDDTPITELELSLRTLSRLVDFGARTLGDLKRLDLSAFRRMSNVGIKSVNEVKDILHHQREDAERLKRARQEDELLVWVRANVHVVRALAAGQLTVCLPRDVDGRPVLFPEPYEDQS